LDGDSIVVMKLFALSVMYKCEVSLNRSSDEF